MKKLISVLMAVAMLLSVAVIAVSAASISAPAAVLAADTDSVKALDANNKDDQGVLYTLDASNMTAVVGKNSYAASASAGDVTGKIVIPAKVTAGGKTYTVTAIGRNAFDGSAITAIECKAAITVGEFAFAGCESLETAVIPFATDIAGFAFWQCGRLTEVAAGSAKTIGGGAFWGCGNLSVVAPFTALQTVKADAFKDCAKLASVLCFTSPEVAADAMGATKLVNDKAVFVESVYAKDGAAVSVYYGAGFAAGSKVSITVSGAEIASVSSDYMTATVSGGTISGTATKGADAFLPIAVINVKGAATVSVTINGETATGTVAVCDHANTKTVTVKSASCTEAGETKTICAACREVISTATTEAKGHDYKDFVIAPTCTEGGYTRHICNVCADRYTDAEVDALGHAWDEGEVRVQATTKKQGLVRYTCQTCGDINDVVVPKIMYGDADGSEKIDLKDASVMMKVIAKWDIGDAAYVPTNADADGNGNINLLDVSLVLKVAARWEVELGPKE